MSAIAHAINRERFPSLAGMGAIAVDVETFDPHLKERGPGAHRDGYIAGIAVGTEAGYRCYYPIANEVGQNLPREDVFSWLRREPNRDVPKTGSCQPPASKYEDHSMMCRLRSLCSTRTA
jgi:hypothetical protein